jgi:NADH-quinone oxidoreductase subunit C
VTTPPGPQADGNPPAEAGGDAAAADQRPENLPERLGAQRLAAPVVRTGMFGAHGSPDTSGYGGLRVHKPLAPSTARPYGGYFDAVADALEAALTGGGIAPGEAIERVVVEHGEVTFFVRREHLSSVAGHFLHDPALRFEIFSGVSGVHYPDEAGRELSAVYHLASITHNRRVRLEVRAPDADPHIPSVTATYPAANWHERETWDFFGIVFDGHPALTRIEMPDDWLGHPQRKDYPLGGIPVEYRGTKVPPPDERRSYYS